MPQEWTRCICMCRVKNLTVYVSREGMTGVQTGQNVGNYLLFLTSGVFGLPHLIKVLLLQTFIILLFYSITGLFGFLNSLGSVSLTVGLLMEKTRPLYIDLTMLMSLTARGHCIAISHGIIESRKQKIDMLYRVFQSKYNG